MAVGLPYDSDGGRSYAAGDHRVDDRRGVRHLGALAARMGPFAGFVTNREPMLQVLQMHRDAAAQLDDRDDAGQLA